MPPTSPGRPAVHRCIVARVKKYVNQFDERIRDAMAEGQKLLADPAVVYARVQELSKIYRRRRWIAQSAGGAVLGVGLALGLVQMNGFIQGGTADVPGPPLTSDVTRSADPARPATVVPDAAPAGVEAPPDQPELDAFFGAGYDWGDAVRLARLWRMADPSDAKIVAGRRLLAGKRLPLDPG